MDIYNQVFSLLQQANLIEYINRGVVLGGGGSRMKGLVAVSKRYLNMPVVLTNKNPAISVSHTLKRQGDSRHFETLSRMIDNPKFYTAFGTLLYSQSEQFKHSERSSDEALIHSQKVSVLKRLNRWLHKTI